MTGSPQVEPASTRTVARPPLVIRRIDAIPMALPLEKPVAMSGVTIGHAENVLVRIEAADGTVGWGEAAAAPTMTGDTQGGLVAAVRYLAPSLIGLDAWQRTELARGLHAALFGNTGAHAAIDMALLDVASRAAGVPLIELLGGARRERVHPMWLLGNATMEQDVAEARARQRDGFRFFKLKVATKPLAQDIATTHVVREALAPGTLLCADANCGFTLETAGDYLEGTRPAGLLFLEQPLPPADLEGLAALSRSSGIPIGADEGIHSLADVEAHARAGIGGVSLKLIKLGGFDVALEAAGLCQHLGLKVNVAAKIAESSIGTAAAVHLACAVPSIDWGVSLTRFYLAEDIVKDPVPLRDGSVALPAGSGLGVDVDEVAVARFRVN